MRDWLVMLEYSTHRSHHTDLLLSCPRVIQPGLCCAVGFLSLVIQHEMRTFLLFTEQHFLFQHDFVIVAAGLVSQQHQAEVDVGQEDRHQHQAGQKCQAQNADNLVKREAAIIPVPIR